MKDAFQAIPVQVRAWIYIIATLVIIGIGAWIASDGNVLLAIVTFATAVQPLVSLSNLNKTDPQPPLEGFTVAELREELASRPSPGPVLEPYEGS